MTTALKLRFSLDGRFPTWWFQSEADQEFSVDLTQLGNLNDGYETSHGLKLKYDSQNRELALNTKTILITPYSMTLFLIMQRIRYRV